MEEEHDIPEIGETVVCEVKQVLNYGAFVELVEYDNKKGFVHVSQVATRWVKNIRNHVKEGQIRAAKVLSLDIGRGQIDLSLTKVSGHAQRARIEAWKQLKRCRKLLEVLAKEQKKDFDDAWEAIAYPLLENHDSLVDAFQDIALKGEAAAEGVSKEWMPALLDLVKKNVTVPEKTLQGILKLRSFDSNGVKVIKDALHKAEKAQKDDIEIFYSGGGKYVLKVRGPDFKAAEKVLNKATETIIDAMKASGGEAKFERSDLK